MRRVLTLAVLGLVVGGLGAHGGEAAGGQCAQALPHAPAGLPAPLLVTTGCGRFRLDPGGGVVYEGARTRPVPPEARVYWMDLTWYGVVDRHLLIGRGMKQLWRSHRVYRGARGVDIGRIVLGRRKLAFSWFRGPRSRLFLAPYGGAEHAVARDETPLGFTSSGAVVTWRNGGALLLRRGDGSLERRLAARAVEPQADAGSRTVVFRTGGYLFAFDGSQVRKLASLRELGVTGFPVVETLGRLLSIHDRRRLVVLDYDGRVIASTPLPDRPKLADGISSSVVPNAAGTAVAFTTTNGNTAYGSHGFETVYLLGAGETRALPLFSEELDFNVCERIAWLAWQGPWLLYADTEQRAALVDSNGQSLPVELGDLISQLPGFRVDGEGIFDIAWSS